MKKKLTIVIVLVLMLALTGCGKENKENNTKLSENFAVDFLKLEGKTENIVYSPLSIKYALKMLNEGANGDTRKEIESVIGDLSVTKYNNIDQHLSLANAVYIKDSYKESVRDTFTNNLVQNYNAEVHYDTFENADNINNFIEEKTFGILKKVVDNSSIDPDQTEVVLINALAIDMKWASSFEKEGTYGQEFTLADGNKVQAAMMHKSADKSDGIAFYKDDNIVALAMDLEKYEDTQLEFMAIMPKGSLADYVKNFKVTEFDEIRDKSTVASRTSAGVDIAIPRFEYEYKLNLKSDLMDLGIKKAFTNEADFSNMTSNPIGLFVSEAIHKAKIEFTEEGIKAAAATVIIMNDRAIMRTEEPEKIVIDNPFLYVIRDKESGEIWFMGTVYNPELWK